MFLFIWAFRVDFDGGISGFPTSPQFLSNNGYLVPKVTCFVAGRCPRVSNPCLFEYNTEGSWVEP